jgi:NADH dehydrogenase
MKKKVIVVGGGFGGLTCARRLAKDKNLDILVLDRRNHHLFQPLLYQVAMAGLSPADISMPIRAVLRKKWNVRVLMAEVTKIDPSTKTVITSIGEFPFDYLVLACGAEHSYFGHNEWEDFAPGLKTLEQATEIRRRVLIAFEKAEAQTDREKMRPWLTFVVVGGGPTGVELAGALGEITRYTLSKDFRHIDPADARILLVEAGSRILAPFTEDLARKAKRDLEELGVHVATNVRVTEVNENGVRMGEEWVQAKTVIWAAGVKPSPLSAQLGCELDRSGRAMTEADGSLKNAPNIFVIGDQAHFPTEDGRGLPGLAPVAIQQGRFVADLIRRESTGHTARPVFKYVDKGTMATIGRRRAVAQIGFLHMSGLIAWYMWLVIHIYFLIGFKNRVLVIWQWFYSYITYRRGARLITERDWHMEKHQ